MKIEIRKEIESDIEEIYALNEKSFGAKAEAELVNRLRQCGALLISLVAVKDKKVLGHISFSPVTIDTGYAPIKAIGLAPMAVLPEFQKQGIGSKLVNAGLEECQNLGYKIAVVLGYPEYYPRFGFQPSEKRGISWEHPAPEGAFMVKELKEGALNGVEGIVNFHPEFYRVPG